MGHLVLRVVEGNATGTELPLDGELLLGRTAGEPGNLGNDATLSRRHARIHAPAGGGVVLEDLGSHNGTRVNGELIAAPHPLAPGDRIELGETILELVAVETPVDPVAPAEGSSREQATRLGRVPEDLPGVAPAEGSSREQATRLGRVPEDLPGVASETSGEQATRLGRVPEDLPGAPAEGSSREQATRVGRVPEGLAGAPEEGWGAHAAPPTRVGRVPEEIVAEAGGSRDRPTRLGAVPAPAPPAGDERATGPAEAPAAAPPPLRPEEQATRLGRVPGEPLAAEPAVAEPAPRPRWWKRIFRGSR